MKVTKKKLKIALRKLEASRETLDKVREAVFVKQTVYEQMEQIGDWLVEVEGLLGRGTNKWDLTKG